MVKSSFPFLNNRLLFNDSRHEYLYNKQKLDSVTKWLSSFDEPFNPYEISEKVSKNKNSEYFGMNPADIRKLWTSTASRGSKKHNKIEKWLNGETASCDEAEFLTQLGITPQTAWPEIPLVSEKLLLAGTADIISFDGTKYIIWDIKTSKKIDNSKVDKFTKQILTYCIMLKHMAGVDVVPGGVISIQPDSNLSTGITHTFNKPILIDINEESVDDLKYMIAKRKRDVKTLIIN